MASRCCEGITRSEERRLVVVKFAGVNWWFERLMQMECIALITFIIIIYLTLQSRFIPDAITLAVARKYCTCPIV